MTRNGWAALLALGLWAALVASAQAAGPGLEPPSSACPNDEPDDGAMHAACPDVDGVPKEGQILTATPGTWSGATTFAYQWQRCTTSLPSSCTDIAGETTTEYIVTEQDGTFGFRLRIEVTATNASGQAIRWSSLTAAAITAVGVPGDNEVWLPRIEVVGEPDPSHPDVGDTLHAADGHAPDPPDSDAFFAPPATLGLAFQWLRCAAATGLDCEPIAGATSRDYTLVAADGQRSLRVRVIGRNVAGARALRSDRSNDVVPAPPSQPPDAVVPDTTAPLITALKLTNKRFRVGPTPTAIVAARRAPQGTTFRFSLSERATVTMALKRLLTGRKVGRRCRPQTRKNRSRRKCTRTRAAGKLTRSGLPADAVAVPFSGRLGRTRLSPGRYRAEVVATDDARNRSGTAKAGFTIVKR